VAWDRAGGLVMTSGGIRPPSVAMIRPPADWSGANRLHEIAPQGVSGASAMSLAR